MWSSNYKIKMNNKKENFKYNIAEYMFYFGTNKRIKLKKLKNTIQTINTKNYESDYWEYTKKKIIWARKMVIRTNCDQKYKIIVIRFYIVYSQDKTILGISIMINYM